MAMAEGKPEAAMPKIVEGGVTGFYKGEVLVDQAFAKDAKKSVGQVLSEAGVEATAFARFSTLTLDDNGNNNTTAVNLANRFGDTSTITLNAGILNFIANPGQGVAPLATAETVGTVTLGAGSSTIQTGYGTAPVFGRRSRPRCGPAPPPSGPPECPHRRCACCSRPTR